MAVDAFESVVVRDAGGRGSSCGKPFKWTRAPLPDRHGIEVPGAQILHEFFDERHPLLLRACVPTIHVTFSR
ncbi:hypothetical protein [Nocardia fusca]|uniref:hypothetical protein n=1 Tax=Nocardia fusca TaxID=941183 RepID=UPI0007A74A40|nr:hypothetical protein [Nocardia fusca]